MMLRRKEQRKFLLKHKTKNVAYPEIAVKIQRGDAPHEHAPDHQTRQPEVSHHDVQAHLDKSERR